VQTKNRKEIGKAKMQENGNYLWEANPVFQSLDLSTVFTIYADWDPGVEREILWISTDDGLIRYDPAFDITSFDIFPTYIRRVTVNNDSLIFGGVQGANEKPIVLEFGNNNLQIKFSAASFIKPEANQYQYFLEGNDQGWSDWSGENNKEYTNLSSGDYTFRVRSKNTYGVIGNEDTFRFTILSPWYLSWWAYLIYLFLFAILFWQFRRYELQRINKKHSMQMERLEFSKLKELDQLKTQFYANISHEFRTPLTLILGQTESVMSSGIDLKEKSKLQVADRNARRLLTLINELLDLSKLEAGGMELKGQKHNIVSFLKSLFFSFESLAESKRISLKFESQQQNIPVLFEPEKMEKVFFNLISNALKFTPEQGEIKVSIKIKDTSQVEIALTDSGVGILADQLPHIFNRFYQADSSNTREYEGTGIGLALTKELVELHNGTITAKSTGGKGSTFTILFPVLELDTSNVGEIENTGEQYFFDEITGYSKKLNNEEEPAIEQSTANDKKEIILIVEDNNDVREYIREQLFETYQVLEAGNGEEGILIAEEYIPDLIITDVMMPKMDGYQFSRKLSLNEKTSHIPIIMLTAKATLDDKLEGLETGVDAYLTKPFSTRELRVRVKNLIYQRQQLRRRFSTATIIKPSEVSAVSADQKFLEKTISIIEHFLSDENFSADRLAEKVNMSVSQLNRKLNALVDQPAGQLIRSMRLQRAADLLKQNAGTIAEICFKVGFNDQAYFARAFKKQFDCSPSDYKKSI